MDLTRIYGNAIKHSKDCSSGLNYPELSSGCPNSTTMAPYAVSPPPESTTHNLLVKPWSRPQETKEDLEWAPLTTIDLSRFEEPGVKQELAKQLYDAITRVGFWVVTGTGIDDERVLRQFSIGNTFFKEPLEEKRQYPCNFAEGEYFGYRENERWIGDTGVKENIEMVRIFQVVSKYSY
jgi:hypothetical protein